MRAVEEKRKICDELTVNAMPRKIQTICSSFHEVTPAEQKKAVFLKANNIFVQPDGGGVTVEIKGYGGEGEGNYYYQGLETPYLSSANFKVNEIFTNLNPETTYYFRIYKDGDLQYERSRISKSILVAHIPSLDILMMEPLNNLLNSCFKVIKNLDELNPEEKEALLTLKKTNGTIKY